jgi:hypothetical protein
VLLAVNAEILYRQEGDVLETRELTLNRDDMSGFDVWESIRLDGASDADNTFYQSMIAHDSTEAPMQDFFAAKIKERQGQGFTLAPPPQAEAG